jgi:protein KTI12
MKKIYCNTPVHLAREWNTTNSRYDEAMWVLGKTKSFFVSNFICISFDALIQRYEPPDGRNRWDAPLFELTPNDELPIEQIADYLANKRPPPPNKSTVNVN